MNFKGLLFRHLKMTRSHAFATPLFRLQKKSAVYVRGKKRRAVVVAVVAVAALTTTNSEDFAVKKICIVTLSKFVFRRKLEKLI